MTSSATAVTYTLGINPDLYRPIAIGLFVTVGLVVTVSPVIYNTIERVEMVLVNVILIFLVFAIFIATKSSSVVAHRSVCSGQLDPRRPTRGCPPTWNSSGRRLKCWGTP